MYLAIEKYRKVLNSRLGGAVPLLRRVEWCVSRHIGKHTPSITRADPPPLKRGTVITHIFPIAKHVVSVKSL